MNRVMFITKEGNSFGDQILKFFVNGEVVTVTNYEGEWEDVDKVIKRLKKDKRYAKANNLRSAQREATA